ncbi:hypothetical protein TNCV_874851 [Trichonephila clavipes]|nr:hypothetical protein TNCV_874851 [Trichonephila clavipes]
MHLGEKTEDTIELNETSPPILVRNRGYANSTRQALNLGEKTEDMPTQRDKPSILVTKLAPDAERQVFERYRSGQVTLQAQPFIDVPVGPAVFGCRKEIRVVHRDTNHFRVFAILQNAGNEQFDRDRRATRGWEGSLTNVFDIRLVLYGHGIQSKLLKNFCGFSPLTTIRPLLPRAS